MSAPLSTKNLTKLETKFQQQKNSTLSQYSTWLHFSALVLFSVFSVFQSLFPYIQHIPSIQLFQLFYPRATEKHGEHFNIFFSFLHTKSSKNR